MKIRSASGHSGSFEQVAIAILMTWTAGFIDLVGYVALYGLYVSHMSGNTVAMARHMSHLDWVGFVRHGWPLATFIFGLILGAFIYDVEKRRHIKVPFPATIGLEVLLVTAFIAAGASSGFKADIPPQPALKFFVMVALLTIAMGLQNVSIRKVGGINVYTTFVTGSLVKFAESVSEFLFWMRDRTYRRFRSRIWKVLLVSPRQVSLQRAALTIALYVAYLAGAVCGGFATDRWALRGMIAPLIVLVAIVTFGAFQPFLEQVNEEW